MFVTLFPTCCSRPSAVYVLQCARGCHSNATVAQSIATAGSRSELAAPTRRHLTEVHLQTNSQQGSSVMDGPPTPLLPTPSRPNRTASADTLYSVDHALGSVCKFRPEPAQSIHKIIIFVCVCIVVYILCDIRTQCIARERFAARV